MFPTMLINLPCTKLSLLALCCLFATIVFSQQIQIKVTGPANEPVPFASIIVKNRFDSSLVASKTADSSGYVSFALAAGQYLFSVSAVNYLPLNKGITFNGTSTRLALNMESAVKALESVTVTTSRRPLMRQEDDKTVMDPEPIAATSASGYEIIEKTPGLFVDQDGNIYISSMTPASVQINGRDMRMSAADIATILKNLPPNAIAKIEIVRSPSAKYEATASGGIVNVVLKKGVKIGMTGSITAGVQQGRYGNQFLGFTLNNNNGKTSSSFTLNAGRRDSYDQIVTDRFFAPDSVLKQNAFTRYPGNNAYTSYELTVELNKKWQITGDASLNYNNNRTRSENRNDISKISTAQNLSSSLNLVNNNGNNLSVSAGLESKYKIDSTGSEWTNGLFLIRTDTKSDQAFSTSYTLPVATVTAGDGNVNSHRTYFRARTDLKLKLRNRFTFETGLQSAIYGYENATAYFRGTGGSRIKDASRTNTFRYNEAINSLYVQGAQTLGKDFVIKFGTRVENTNMMGRQVVPGDTSFNIHRTDLFPFVYLSKNLVSIAGYPMRAYLIYRRSISRPSYDQLNPFRRYVDEYLTETGNPGLRPQFTGNYEANISVNEQPILAIGLNDTKDIFTNVVYQSDTSQSMAYRTYDNLGKSKEWYFRAMGALPPGGKYFFVAGAQYNHNDYQGLYENKPLAFKRGTWTFFTYHSLKLGKKSVATLNGFLRLKGQQQFYELGSFGALHASVNRKFMKDKLIVTLSVNDIFYTNKNDFTIKQGSVNANGSRMGDTRRVGINFRYNFGIRKKEENNEMYNAVPGN
ncbi:Outer membrane receptor proteins, mostly Fe transport [Sediminibacterium ginsengisoli]|uniref:Outer membrane receptor proteins, mostly Fe transport n=2 Tax=Sediminibacterium ginsengisoli TaxID=413434 RepID=A0A1T4RF22_9BACT|nr:Outer membrane receptor proteins, mostly Fe transport [Sediminibacterium ginsengisoli]